MAQCAPSVVNTTALFSTIVSFLLTTPSPAAEEPPSLTPALGQWLGSIPSRFARYDVVAVPDKDQAEWWAGAPSVVREDNGTFWMAARMRTPDAPLGQRGYEIRIYRSPDGIHFDKVHSIPREQVPIPGFERPAMLKDPKTGKFKLYACGPLNGPWCIIKFDDADTPAQFLPATARPVITPPAPQETRPPDLIVGTYSRGPALPTMYKDPFIFHAAGTYHCYLIGHLRAERCFHFTSSDGERWQPVGEFSKPIMDLDGWHNFAVRPACLVPLGVGYLFVYEGSDARWADPVYNIATGLAFTFDLHQVIDLTPDNPLLISTTPGRLHTWRYSHWLWVNNELWAYAEVEKANGAHEIRLFRLSREWNKP
jgi:hypothetical protein